MLTEGYLGSRLVLLSSNKKSKEVGEGRLVGI